jgi:hypothetical protein
MKEIKILTHMTFNESLDIFLFIKFLTDNIYVIKKFILVLS